MAFGIGASLNPGKGLNELHVPEGHTVATVRENDRVVHSLVPQSAAGDYASSSSGSKNADGSEMPKSSGYSEDKAQHESNISAADQAAEAHNKAVSSGSHDVSDVSDDHAQKFTVGMASATETYKQLISAQGYALTDTVHDFCREANNRYAMHVANGLFQSENIQTPREFINTMRAESKQHSKAMKSSGKASKSKASKAKVSKVRKHHQSSDSHDKIVADSLSRYDAAARNYFSANTSSAASLMHAEQMRKNYQKSLKSALESGRDASKMASPERVFERKMAKFNPAATGCPSQSHEKKQDDDKAEEASAVIRVHPSDIAKMKHGDVVNIAHEHLPNGVVPYVLKPSVAVPSNIIGTGSSLSAKKATDDIGKLRRDVYQHVNAIGGKGETPWHSSEHHGQKEKGKEKEKRERYYAHRSAVEPVQEAVTFSKSVRVTPAAAEAIARIQTAASGMSSRSMTQAKKHSIEAQMALVRLMDEEKDEGHAWGKSQKEKHAKMQLKAVQKIERLHDDHASEAILESIFTGNGIVHNATSM